MTSMPEALAELVRDAAACVTLESLACGKGMPKAAPRRARRRATATRATKPPPFDMHERVHQVVQACRAERKRSLAATPEEDLSDARLSKLARFTDALALAPYTPFLHFVPRLVNIVRPYQPLGYRSRMYKNDHNIHRNSIVMVTNTQSSLPIPPRAGDARRGGADARLGPHAGPAARPGQDRRALQWGVFRSQKIRGGARLACTRQRHQLHACRTPLAGPASVHESALPHPRLPHGPPGRNRL